MHPGDLLKYTASIRVHRSSLHEITKFGNLVKTIFGTNIV